MGENSLIEWTNHSFNPWLGCTKISAGCDFCYAEALMDHRLHKVEWGPHGERIRTSPVNWARPKVWAKKAAALGVRHRVFCASLADWLDNKVPPQWRLELGELITATPELDWLLLTKRIENFDTLSPWLKVPANVWLGVTCEDQAAARRRIPILSGIPAPVRFLSVEPMIGPVFLADCLGWQKLDWVICGGESGASPRPMDPLWVKALQTQCQTAGIAWFFKQMAGKQPIPSELMIREFPVPRVN